MLERERREWFTHAYEGGDLPTEPYRSETLASRTRFWEERFIAILVRKNPASR